MGDVEDPDRLPNGVVFADHAGVLRGIAQPAKSANFMAPAANLRQGLTQPPLMAL